MVDITEISAAVAAAGVLVGVVYYILDMRNQDRIRKTDLIMRLHSFYSSEEFTKATARVLATEYKDYINFVEKYGSLPSPNEVQISFGMVGSFFEGLGVLLSERLLDINLVQKMFMVEAYWKKAEPIVKGLRKQFGNPTLFEWFEYLYNETKIREQTLQAQQ